MVIEKKTRPDRGKTTPCGIVLLEEDLHAGRENPRTPLPTLHKGHTIPYECWAGP
jgi:hypothetical protein